MKELKLDCVNCFISGWFIDEKICDGVVSFFEESPDKKEGVLGYNYVDKSKKDSTDVIVNPKNPDIRVQNYLDNLSLVCDLYIKKFPHCSNNHSVWGLNTNFNLQRYLPGQGFKNFHSERTSFADLIPMRHLVWMTYLNDVNDAGETEWYHQNLKIKPEKGLTLIWPVDWTYLHRGIPSQTETKYIVTGWYTYFIPDFDYDSFNTL